MANDLITQTARLTLRRLHLGDAPFILELVNDPQFLRNIGDRGVRNLDDARRYLESGPLASYEEHGFGLFLMERRTDTVPIGICGLLKRPTLEDADVGFALLPAFHGRGYATEAAEATLKWGRQHLGLDRVVAITSPDNVASARVLEKIGLRFDRMIRLAEDGEDVRFFVSRDP